MIHKKKILMLGNSHLVIFGFRGELIERFIAEGYDVTVAFPNGPFGEGEKTSREFGCKFIEIPMNRRGVNPIQELYLLWRYKVLIRKVQPDIVLAYTVKCDIYGGFACRTLGIPFIPNITGLGKGLAEGGLMRLITSTLYKFAMKNAACVFFQNQQDRQFFLDSNIPIGRNRVLPGSGVNLRKFKPLPYPESEPVVFTYIARVMKAKGIEQFLDAAKVIKTEFPDTEFHICGYCEENYKDVIARAEREGSIHYHGLADNIIDYERMSHCIVLPTFHPEGISNVLLEAAACARPLITTNRAGCRETVEDGVTGYLIKERSSQDLIEKMRMFLALTYVNNTSSNNESTTITQSDLSASTQLVNTYSAIITSDMVLNQVIAKADVDLEVESLAKKIEINAVNHTEVFKVSVLDSDPKAAARIANAIAEIAPNQLSKIVDGSSVKVVDYGKIPTDIESPSYPKAAAVGIILGFLISVVVIILSEVMDTTIKTGSDLEEWGLPVLGIVPDFEEAEKHSSYGYRYGNQKAGNRS